MFQRSSGLISLPHNMYKYKNTRRNHFWYYIGNAVVNNQGFTQIFKMKLTSPSPVTCSALNRCSEMLSKGGVTHRWSCTLLPPVVDWFESFGGGQGRLPSPLKVFKMIARGDLSNASISIWVFMVLSTELSGTSFISYKALYKAKKLFLETDVVIGQLLINDLPKVTFQRRSVSHQNFFRCNNRCECYLDLGYCGAVARCHGSYQIYFFLTKLIFRYPTLSGQFPPRN